MKSSARFAAVQAVVVAAAACSDPEIAVTLSIPEPYRDLVASTVLHVLSVPPATPFGCDEIAFGEVAVETLQATQSQQVSISPEEQAPLAGVDRVGQKLFWAEGFGEDGRPVVEACAAFGTVARDTPVHLVAEPAVDLQAAVPGQAFRALFLPGSPPYTVSVMISDYLYVALDGIAVKWKTAGARGEGDAGSVVTTAGAADVEMRVPNNPGPVMARIRARWQRNELGDFSGMIQPQKWTTTLGFDPTAIQVGKVGPNSELGFIAVEAGASPPVVHFFYEEVDGEPFAPSDHPVALAAGTVETAGLIRTSGPDRDRVVVILGGAAAVGSCAGGCPSEQICAPSTPPACVRDCRASGAVCPPQLPRCDQGNGLCQQVTWLDVPPPGAGAVTFSPLLPPSSSARAATAMVAIEACAPGIGDAAVVLQFATSTPDTVLLGVYGGDGTLLPEHPFTRVAPSPLAGGGCVGADGPNPALPALVLVAPNMVMPMFVQTGSGPNDVMMLGLVGAPGTVGFTPPAVVGDVPLVLAPHILVDSVRLARVAVTGVESGVALLANVLAEDPVQALPVSPVGGDFDQDGVSDVAALLLNAESAPRIVLVLGATLDGERIQATPSIPIAPPGPTAPESHVAHLFVADFDDDGTDDLSFVERRVARPPATDVETNVTIWRMGQIETP